MVDILPRAKQQPAGLIACGLRTAALFSSTPSCRKKGTSLSRCLLLAEMVGFEPTCPIKDKTISSRSRYDHFDTSPYSNHAVERSANIHTANPIASLLYQKSRIPSTGFHCRRGGARSTNTPALQELVNRLRQISHTNFRRSLKFSQNITILKRFCTNVCRVRCDILVLQRGLRCGPTH